MSKKVFVRIGSNPTNDLVIKGIDSFHMELFRDTDGNVFISDLNKAYMESFSNLLERS
jgi:hypothetical protein